MNDNKNDNKTRPAGLFIGVAAVIVFLALGIAVWVEGPRYEWSRDTRIIIELSLFSALLVVLLLVKHFELVLLWIASLRASRWFASYDAGKRAASNLDEPAGQVDHATALRNVELRYNRSDHSAEKDQAVPLHAGPAKLEPVAADAPSAVRARSAW